METCMWRKWTGGMLEEGEEAPVQERLLCSHREGSQRCSCRRRPNKRQRRTDMLEMGFSLMLFDFRKRLSLFSRIGVYVLDELRIKILLIFIVLKKSHFQFYIGFFEIKMWKRV